MAEFNAVELLKQPKVPAISPAAGAKFQTYRASDTHMTDLGYPGKQPDDWQQRIIRKLGEVVAGNRSLRIALDTCVQCGSCADKCHYFLGTGDPNNMPVARQELMRKVYRKYYTLGGKLFGRLAGGEPMTEEVLKEWYTYFHQCSECRRCSVFCPYGIDTAEVTMAARDIMASIGVGQKYTMEIIGKVHKIGNNLGLPGPALKGVLEGLEEDIKDGTGVDVRMPLDEKGAEVLFVPPSADFFAEPHVESLIGYAKVLHQAGISWTLSSYASEAGNFGLFIGDNEQMRKVSLRIRKAAQDLGVRRIIIGECGHAWRVAYNFLNRNAGPFDFLDPKYPVPQHICEVTDELIRRGALKLDPTANDNFTVTFHDSCNVARASGMGDRPGGQFEIPRAIIRSVANKVVEMDPETTYEKTFCCGGGGGLLTDEIIELRIRGALPRMRALKDVIKSDGVNFMASICAICKAQFSKIMPSYDVPRETVGGVHQLVGRAIQLGVKQ